MDHLFGRHNKWHQVLQPLLLVFQQPFSCSLPYQWRVDFTGGSKVPKQKGIWFLKILFQLEVTCLRQFGHWEISRDLLAELLGMLFSLLKRDRLSQHANWSYALSSSSWEHRYDAYRWSNRLVIMKIKHHGRWSRELEVTSVFDDFLNAYNAFFWTSIYVRSKTLLLNPLLVGFCSI